MLRVPREEVLMEEEGLLRAIIAQPEDDWPRLVYADWLEERGDTARGEFLQLQVAARTTPLGSPDQQGFWARLRACRNHLDPDWLKVVDSPAVLMEQHRGKSRDELRALIIARFGPPNRDIGSGLSIPQWEVDGGLLTFHPFLGPSFTSGGTKKWLIRTTNPVGACVFGHYGMATLPDPSNYGNCRSLGSVCLFEDGRYVHTDVFRNPPQGDQEQNYFLRHPTGSATVELATGITPQTLLESLPEGAPVATVVVSAGDGETNQTYAIVLDLATRRLRFESVAPMRFQLWKGWVNYWA
jgi:uncharacterized protein (TIGR02996 family)